MPKLHNKIRNKVSNRQNTAKSFKTGIVSVKPGCITVFFLDDSITQYCSIKTQKVNLVLFSVNAKLF